MIRVDVVEGDSYLERSKLQTTTVDGILQGRKVMEKSTISHI